jgi:hypothetical protein
VSSIVQAKHGPGVIAKTRVETAGVISVLVKYICIYKQLSAHVCVGFRAGRSKKKKKTEKQVIHERNDRYHK